ncbi:hypothetical protein E1B28_002611 [Marasmius oreades]|uniref:Uncharacterized protein n=1 Tax=Marasmius oreades TaxID=181124 RepID=A0A9P7UN97_9AGAR|nr:uncharacterized protein E1B28_002611 [Marasmius oreades]KAG7086671.1 hypothetical protein E1B28_002611 [Marasmius oreades]
MPTTKSSTLFSRSNPVPFSNITNVQDVSVPSQIKKQASQDPANVQDFCLHNDPFHSMSDSYYCSELETMFGFAFFEDLDNFSVYRRGGQTLSVASRSVSRSPEVFRLEEVLGGEEASCDLVETDVERTPMCESPVILLPPVSKALLGIVVTPPTPTKPDCNHQQKRINSTFWISDNDWNASGDAASESDSDTTSVDVFDWNAPGDAILEFQTWDVYGGIAMDFHDSHEAECSS